MARVHFDRLGTRRGTSLLALLATLLPIVLLQACARTAAQPADPPPPKVTIGGSARRARSPNGTSSLAGSKRSTPWRSGRACPATCRRVRFHEGAIVKRGDLLFQIDPRPFQAEVDRLRAELVRARATVSRADFGAAARRAPADRERDVARGAAIAAPRSPPKPSAQVAAVEAALRAAELNLEFTRVTAPIDGRVGRAIVTEGNLVSSGPGEATLLTTRRLARSDLRVVRRRRADVPPLRQPDARRQARQRARRPLPIQHGARQRQGLPARRARWTSSTTRSIRRPARSADARSFRNTDGALTPGLFVRLQLPGSGSYQRPADSGPRGRHRSRQALRARRRRRSHGRSTAPSRSARSSTACASCAAA